MKSLYLIIILILLIFIIYYYNKSQAYEKLEHFDDNLINQIASIINGDKLIINNLEVTGNLTAPNITTDNIYSTGGENSWLNLQANVHGYKDYQSDGKISSKTNIESPNITTRYLEATTDGRIDAPSLYIKNQLFTKDIQPAKWDSVNKDTININANTKINDTLTLSNITVNKKLSVGTKKEEGSYNKAGIFYWTHPLEFDGKTLKKAW